MFGLVKNIFIALLTGQVNGSNHTKCVFFSNQKRITQPTLIYILKNTDKNFTTIHYQLN